MTLLFLFRASSTAGRSRFNAASAILSNGYMRSRMARLQFNLLKCASSQVHKLHST